MKLAKKIAQQAPLAIWQAKAAINAGIEMDRDSGLRVKTEAVALAFSKRDKQEGMAAFLELLGE